MLVDSTTPAAASSSTRDRASSDLTDRLSALVSTTARLGLGRPLGVPTASHLRSTIGEDVRAGASARQAAALRDSADQPLVVLTAGRVGAAGWSAEQDALATPSTDSDHRVVPDVDHAGLITDERGAAATTRAVLDVVSAVRSAPPLID